ncbi:MAG: hypothetical protein P0116_13620 [Candidatus Nitrosocosmicus sp.]|nr:hypothetical protein [Candidatus Nitrosocosmicus sp.]
MVYYTMRNLRALLFATALLIASFASISSVSNFVSAIPSEIIDDQFVFGPIVGLSENQSGAVDWIMVGNWRLNMANDTDVQNNHHSDVF